MGGRRKEKKGQESKDEQVISIKIIETPRGPVPHAETLVSLVKAWNNTLVEISTYLKEILDELKALRLGIRKLEILLTSSATSVPSEAPSEGGSNEEIAGAEVAEKERKKAVKSKAKDILQEFL